jgi:hypothetical protein
MIHGTLDCSYITAHYLQFVPQIYFSVIQGEFFE